MKRMLGLLSIVLALNFLALAGGVGWLYQNGKLDREKIAAIRELLFPPPPPSDVAATTQPTTQPVPRLEDLLAKHAGLPAAEQLQYIRQSFDARMAQLDRAQRNLLDLQRTVKLAQDKLGEDRLALEDQKTKFEAKEKEGDRLAQEKGFQDTLTLYSGMQAKQTKAIFMTMDDALVAQYLTAMEERTATKIAKEFKTPDEVERLKRIMEQVRQSQAATN